jgi:NADH-quinone oxidoreductase subunit E
LKKEKILSSHFYETMQKLESKYPTKVALLLPALHQAQEETRWLSSDVLDEIASYIGIHPAQVREVASFYTMYNLSPVGKYHIKLCTNVSCALRGADDLMKLCEKRLNIIAGETTADQMISLSHEECLGACGQAPVLTLNEEYRENLDVVKMGKILDECSQ